MIYTSIDAEFQCGSNGAKCGPVRGRHEDLSAKNCSLAEGRKSVSVREPLGNTGCSSDEKMQLVSAVLMV